MISLNGFIALNICVLTKKCILVYKYRCDCVCVFKSKIFTRYSCGEAQKYIITAEVRLNKAKHFFTKENMFVCIYIYICVPISTVNKTFSESKLYRFAWQLPLMARHKRIFYVFINSKQVCVCMCAGVLIKICICRKNSFKT